MATTKLRITFTGFILILILFTEVAGSGNNTTKVILHDTCFEERTGIFPCSSTITGNVLLIVFYALFLAVAAKLISDGAELLLDLGLPASIVGGLILPLLGAVPDSAIIIVSGLGPKEDAQRKLAVGMGTLAGSTIMLLTIAWAGSLYIGRCDLDSKGESIDETGDGPIEPFRQGVTLLPEFRSGLIIMVATSMFYLIIQSADWVFGATNFGPQPAYVRKCALVTMIFCFLGLFGYIGYLLHDSKAAEIRLKRHREEKLQRKVLHKMLLIADRDIFKPSKPVDVEAQDQEDTGTTTAPSHDVSKKYFKAWHMRKGMKKEIVPPKELNEGDYEETSQMIENEKSDAPKMSEGYGSLANVEEKVSEEGEEDSRKTIAIKSVSMLLGGVALVTIFADPMCDALDALTNERNKQRIPISSFYVSFVVTPFCSNASELVSSLIFASKRKRANTTITYSQLFGASTMNNTMCLGIFMALVYFRELEWYYSAEVLVILLVQWLIALVSFRNTYKLWLGVPVAFVYFFSIFFVWILEKCAGWK